MKKALISAIRIMSGKEKAWNFFQIALAIIIFATLTWPILELAGINNFLRMAAVISAQKIMEFFHSP